MKKTFFLSLFCIFFCFAYPANAQFGLPQETIEITPTPRFPEPNSDVTLSLNAYSLDMSGATIRWSIDDVTQINANNQRSLSVISGDTGTTNRIVAEVTTKNSTVVTAVYDLTPTRVDIIIEANTLTPVFYKGRSLPSVGSNIRAVAISGEDTLAANGLTYTWKLNNKVLGGGSTVGQSSVTFPMPIGREANLSLEVANGAGVLIAGKNIIIPAVEPELYFYPDNPLRALSRLSTGPEFLLLGSEIDIRAEPYYMDDQILTKDFLIEWEIDNQTVTNPNTDPQTITLQNAGGSGRFSIGFHIRNLQSLVQGVEDNFILRF